jgi:hypothetical protein
MSGIARCCKYASNMTDCPDNWSGQSCKHLVFSMNMVMEGPFVHERIQDKSDNVTNAW